MAGGDAWTAEEGTYTVPPTLPPTGGSGGSNGEEACEGHDYSESQCSAVGCCQWDDGEVRMFCLDALSSQCWSAVGDGPCSTGGSTGLPPLFGHLPHLPHLLHLSPRLHLLGPGKLLARGHHRSIVHSMVGDQYNCCIIMGRKHRVRVGNRSSKMPLVAQKGMVSSF